MYKILIADDEPFFRDGLKVIIDWKSEGFEIAGEAKNGLEAVELLKNNSYDLIISDIKMPGLDGIELMTYVRENISQTLPFVILSGFYDFEYAKSAIKYHADNYLLKPVDPEELTALIKEIKEKFPLEDDSIIGQIINEINTNYSSNLNLKMLSEKYFINSAYLGQLFKKETGKFFKDYLSEVRIEHACEMIEKTDEKIYRIAAECGFSDVDGFSAKFAQIKEMTPNNYRKLVKSDGQ